MTSIKLYYSNFTRATRPRWLLEELGVPYELVPIDMKAGAHKQPQYVDNVHPHGAVPAAEIDGKHIIESGAIVATLADRFLDKGLAPKTDSPDRAAYFQWLFYSQATLEPAIVQMLEVKKANEAGAPLADTVQREAHWKTALGFIEKGLGKNDWITGQRFSAVDCVLGSLLAWANGAKIVEGYPAIAGYVDRCKARPAFQKARKD